MYPSAVADLMSNPITTFRSYFIEHVRRLSISAGEAAAGSIVSSAEPVSHANPGHNADQTSAQTHTTNSWNFDSITETALEDRSYERDVSSPSESAPVPQPPAATRRPQAPYAFLEASSANPAHSAAESLRSVDSLLMSETPPGGTSNAGTRSGQGSGNHTPHMAAATERGPNRVNMMSGALPENDGMQSLRDKLHQIRQMAVSTEEKAKRMHFIMTQDFIAHRTDVRMPSTPSEAIPSRLGTARETMASFSLDGPTKRSPTAPFADPNNPYNICTTDLEPSYCPESPSPPTDAADTAGTDEAMEEDPVATLGCVHYSRNVKVQCHDCHLWFPCRHCHDESDRLPFRHILNRKKTQNMLCMLCRTPQSAAESCINCGESAAWYYCPKCKLWDNDSQKRIYHCDDCGICRRGEGLGKDYVHCRRCNVCISISTSDAHPCVERATDCDCPLCLIHLFESPNPVVSLPCGHYMHALCYKDLMAVSYRCPVCNKSAVNMELQWRKLDDEIRMQPMPEEDEDLEGLMPVIEQTQAPDAGQDVSAHQVESALPARVRRPRNVWIGCNDCGGRGWTPFHWLGLKCTVCDSYNTNQMTPTAGRETETERLVRQQQIHRHHDFTGNEVLRSAGIGMLDEDRADSAFGAPSSPSQVPINAVQAQARGPQSPGRSYFRQADAEEQQQDRLSAFELPTFSPYEMIRRVSRNLSPMRYYLEGSDAREENSAEGSASRASKRALPSGDDARRQQRGMQPINVEDEHAVEFWGEDGHFLSGEEDQDGEESDEASSESEDSDQPSDVEMAEDEAEPGNEDEDMELFGHR